MPAEGALRDGTAAGFELIETLRWEPGEGFVRLDRHLARLANSARALGFSCDARAVREVLEGCAGGNTALRVRLTLAEDGRIAATNAPFEPLPADAVWTLRPAKTRLNSADPLIRHKTTRRQVYEAARAEYSRGEADEVLLLNERGEVCEGTITNVFADFGEPVLVTPAPECGLLPGVLRGEMIEQGRAKEAVLTEADLRTAKAVYVGNSLRGLIGARLESD
jgi:4-amino-4-deoxychorismate lyase